MHRKDNKRMGLLSYIKGDRKGRKAHNLEREAMQDPFLADALEGYGNVADPELDIRLDRMEKAIEAMSQPVIRDYMSGEHVMPHSKAGYPAVYAAAKRPADDYDMGGNAARTSGQSRSSRRRRRSYVFWLCAAAVMLFVCTISFELGILSGEKHNALIAMNDMEQVTVDMPQAPATDMACYEQEPMIIPETSSAENSAKQLASDAVESAARHSSTPAATDSPGTAAANRREQAKQDKAEHKTTACKMGRRNETVHFNACNTVPHPVAGYKAYYEYIYERLELPSGPETDGLNGIAVLSFNVDENGQPGDFMIVECSSRQVAELIIEIMKDCGTWTGSGPVPSFTLVY